MNHKSVDSLTSHLKTLCQRDSDFNSLTNILKELSSVMKSDSYRYTLTPDNWNFFESLSKVIQNVLSKDSFLNEELNFLAEFFRFLRNSCGCGIVENQRFILSSKDILNSIKKTISCFKDRTLDLEVSVLKCCIQLLGNLVCSSHEAKNFVWTYFLEQKIFQCLFNHADCKVREYTMMVLYNCMYDEAARFLILSQDGHHILTLLLEGLCKDLVDWGILFLELILKHENFFPSCYQMLPVESRLLILDIIIEQFSSGEGQSYFSVPSASIHFIKDLFIEYVMNIVQVCNSEAPHTKSIEIVRLLSLLCDASVLDAYCIELKSSRQLLETSLDTLKTVHLLGKKDSNAFSCICSLKSINKKDKEAIECNPSYGFKKNLIRLIGNLCFNNKDNQDIVRQQDGIPLLLDCCNLDARNPFIMQWGILAIRNIMEKNSENQAVLASVTLHGDLVNSALIKEMGFEVSNNDGKYVLRPLQS